MVQLVFCLCALLSVPAHADTIEWQSAAMACVPSGTTVQQEKYVTTGGRVKFKPGQFGIIRFICPVSGPLPSGEYALRGRIKTPIASRFGISLKLRKANNSSGNVNTVLSVNQVQTANVSGSRVADSGIRSIDFNFERNTYWVDITYDNTRGETLSILSVQLIRIR
ncbi:MAG: hypothetical protein ABFS02_05275 [Pseudomonadota bacterium]